MTTRVNNFLLSGSSADMRALRITQDGAGTPLRRPAAAFVFPRETMAARRTVDALRQRAAKVRRVHTFRTGMGLAAPQIGIRRRAAIVFLADPGRMIELLNPVVVEQSAEEETRFEGCLSFFDVRGLVARPTRLRVVHQRSDGAPLESEFHGNVARLVAHEIDHLDGILYTERLAGGSDLLPVERYREQAAHH